MDTVAPDELIRQMRTEERRLVDKLTPTTQILLVTLINMFLFVGIIRLLDVIFHH